MTAQRREDVVSSLPGALPEDRELTLAFQRGDKGAYQAIYDRYHQRVLNVCRRMLGKPEDAEEAAQEAFLRVYQALYRFNGRYQLGPWVTRIATNVCLDHIRSRSRRPSEAMSDELLELELDTDEENPEVIHLKRVEGRRIRRVLDGLPPMHRAAIVLRDFEGLSYEEVAIALGISDCQTKALIHRARKSFKRSWNPVNGLQVLIPWRWIERVKRPDALHSDNVGEVARNSSRFAEGIASFSHVASSCGTALQQCGQFMGERMTALATTVLVGTAAIGGVAAGQHRVPPGSPNPPAQTSSAQPTGGWKPPARTGVRKKLPAQAALKQAPHQRVASASVIEPEGPLPSPAPAATPSPSPTPSPTPSATPSSAPPAPPAKSEGDSGSASNAPTQVALGFARGGTPPSAAPSSDSTTVDCASGAVTQELVAPVWDGDASYEGQLTLRLTKTSSQFSLSLTRAGSQYSYNGGSSQPLATRSEGKLELTFNGSFSWSGGERPSNAGLPDSGRFSGRLLIDCAAEHVLTESLLFTT